MDGALTSRSRVLAAGVVGVLALGVLAGCGSPTDHLRDICTDVTTGTRALAAYDPADPVTAVQYAIGRFTLVERAVSTAREAGLPGADADALRRGWLDPAVTSMASWDTRIETLRVAVVARDAAGITAALPPAVAVGTEGVDDAPLRAAGLDACVTAFTAPDPSA